MKNYIIEKIKSIIKNTSFENNTYIAGGFVRDFIMQGEDFSCNDIDIVVSKNGIDGGIKLAKMLQKELNANPLVVYDHIQLNANSFVVYERFGTAKFVINGVDVEFVATRKESYANDSRNCEVKAGTLFDDVMRRDFTINSILYDISNDCIIDLTQKGIDDINGKIIRATNRPDIIFGEDPLRIMRTLRFATRFNFNIEENTYKGVVDNVSKLANISRERIRDEFNKILMDKNVIVGLKLLKETDILEHIVPEFKALYKVKKQGKSHIKDAWNHTLDVVNRTKNTLEHRLAALFHDLGKAKTQSIDENGEVHFYGHQAVSTYKTKQFMRKYKYTKEQIDFVTTAISMHMSFCDEMNDKTIRKLANKHGEEKFMFALDLAEADSFHRDRIKFVKSIKQFIKDGKHVITKAAKLPIDGNFLMKRYNIKPSKIIGEMLEFEKELLFENPSIKNEDIIIKIDNNFNKEIIHD